MAAYDTPTDKCGKWCESQPFTVLDTQRYFLHIIASNIFSSVVKQEANPKEKCHDYEKNKKKKLEKSWILLNVVGGWGLAKDKQVICCFKKGLGKK